jgi:hypothetical protein
MKDIWRKDLDNISLKRIDVRSGILQILGPQPSFGEPWPCLTIFGNSMGWSKTRCLGEAEIAGSRPLLRDFWGLGFM